MLGMILMATKPTLVSAGFAEIAREHRVGAVSVGPELQVRPQGGAGNLRQQLRRRNYFNVCAYGKGFVQYVAGFASMRGTGEVADDAASSGAADG
jgi:hypothetical protein